jgi:Carbohydrate esterase, sialic acid-specific acetylesterase
VLLIGQSNMSGRGQKYKAAIDGVQEARIAQWSRQGTVVPASERLQHADWVEGATEVGMGTSFARAYVSVLAPQRNVLLVPSAYGGTGFSSNNWNPGDAIYEQAISRITAALAANPGNCLAAVLWHQGENDAGVMTQQTYATALDRMITDLRTRVPGARSTPFVLGEFTPEWIAAVPAAQQIIDAINDTPNRLRYTAVAPSAGLLSNTRVGINDIVHFDARAMRTYGNRYFKALTVAAANR